MRCGPRAWRKSGNELNLQNMNKEYRVWRTLRYPEKSETLRVARAALKDAATDEEQCACKMVLAITYIQSGSELAGRATLKPILHGPRDSPLFNGALLLLLLLEERFNGIHMPKKKRDAARVAFLKLDRARPEFFSIARIMFEAEKGFGDAEHALEIAGIPGVTVFPFELVDLQFSVGRPDLAISSATAKMKCNEHERAVGALAMGYAHLKMRGPVRARAFLEYAIRSQTREQAIKRNAYQELQKCYQMLSIERFVNGSPEDRFRACAECDTIIDRQPLLAQDEDFLVCGGCRNVPFCSEECHDAHWPAHRLECGKSQLPEKRIDLFAPDMCCECLCRGAKLQCTRCKLARYCDAKCQKAHWKSHKKACGSQQKLGGGESL